MVALRTLVTLQGHVNEVTAVHLEPKEDVYITGSDDQSIRIWVKRENGVFWPCHIQYLDTPLSCLSFDRSSMILVAGLTSGSCLAYKVAKDFNNMQPCSAQLKGHAETVQFIEVDSKMDLIVSGGVDGLLQLHTLSTMQYMGVYNVNMSICSLALASDQSLLYIGCDSGDVIALKVSKRKTTLEGQYSGQHVGPINTLTYDPAHKRLFSGGADRVVGVWDMSSTSNKTINALKLNAHAGEVISVTYDAAKNTLLSLDGTGKLCIWDMSVKRECAPAWKESDTCQLCQKPFYWNVQKTPIQFNTFKFEMPKFNVTRQHHCRACGKATCSECVPHRLRLPYYGYEDSVLVCTLCHPHISANITNSNIRYLQLPGTTSIKLVPGTENYVTIHKDFCTKTIALKD